MATNAFIRSSPPSFNIGPGIIQPTAGDLEEARVRRAMDMAKLQGLIVAPQQEQQRLDLARSAQQSEQSYRTGVLGETQAHNVAEEQHWTNLLGLDKNKFDQSVTEHKQNLSELTDYHQGLLKNQLTDSFMTHLSALYPKEVVQKVLEGRNLPELSAAAEQFNTNANQKVADSTLQSYNLVKAKDPTKAGAVLENLKATNPDAYGLIKDKVDSADLPVETTTTASKLGDTTRKLISASNIASITGNPGMVLAGLLGSAIGGKTKVPTSGLHDFMTSLLGNPQSAGAQISPRFNAAASGNAPTATGPDYKTAMDLQLKRLLAEQAQQ